MTCRPFRRVPRSAYLVLPALTVWLFGCPPPSDTNTFDPSSLLPSPPEQLPDLSGRTVNVALFADRLPFSQLDQATGTFTGFDVDLISTMATRLNFAPHFVAADPTTLLADLAAGRYDLAGGGIAYTLERATQFDFASPYDASARRLAVRAGDTRATTIAAFHDQAALRSGAVSLSTTYDLAVAFLGASRVVGFDSFDAAADALVAGDIDGILLGDADLLHEQARLPNLLVALPGAVGGDLLAYALLLGSDLTDAINAAYLQLQSEGEIVALRQKWGL